MDDTTLESYRTQVLRKLRRRKKSAGKAIEKLRLQSKEAEEWHALEREGLVLQANIYQIPKDAVSVKLLDWESEQEISISLEPRLSLSDQVKKKVRRSKKLRAAVPYLEKQLLQAESFVEKLDAALAQVEGAESVELIAFIEKEFELVPPTPKSRETKPEVKLPYKEYHSKGTKIWVGKGAKENDQLTFTHANGSDWWLHVNEYSGSHVVIRTHQGKEPDSVTLSDAIQLAIGQSKAPKIGKVEICLTQVKFVKKFKGGKPGTVHLSKHKKLVDEFDKERYDSILRLLP